MLVKSSLLYVCHEIPIIHIFVTVFVFFACRYLIVSFHYLKFVRSIVNYLSFCRIFIEQKNVTSILVVIILGIYV